MLCLWLRHTDFSSANRAYAFPWLVTKPARGSAPDREVWVQLENSPNALRQMGKSVGCAQPDQAGCETELRGDN